MASNKFSDIEIDALGEIMNISLGSSATAVSTMLDTRVDITTPTVRVVDREHFSFTNLQPAVGVEITYISGLDGKNVMLLKRRDVKIIIELLMGMEIPDDQFELDEMNISAICEVMNQMMGASSTALSEFLGKVVNISTPRSFEVENEDGFKDMYFKGEDEKVVIGFILTINDRLESEFVNVMSVELAKELLAGFLPEDVLKEAEKQLSEEAGSAAPAAAGMGGEIPAGMPAAAMAQTAPPPGMPPQGMGMPGMPLQGMPAQSAPVPAVDMSGMPAQGMVQPGMAQAAPQQRMTQEEAFAAAMALQQQAQAMGQQPIPAPAPAPAQPMVSNDAFVSQQLLIQQMMQQMQTMQEQIISMKNRENKIVGVNKVSHPELNSPVIETEEQAENLELVMGVPLEISVEIGRTQGLVKDILEYTKGTLVVLDRQAGDQVDLFVNGQCIARGDVVVVDDNFGIRITEILKRPEII